MMEKEVDYIYKHYYNENRFCFTTIEIKKILQGVPITDYEVIDWIKKHIIDGLKEIVNS